MMMKTVASKSNLALIKRVFFYILGRTHNKINILKAFLIGLLRQRTHQELANEKRLHLVEMRAEMGNFPVVSMKYILVCWGKIFLSSCSYSQ